MKKNRRPRRARKYNKNPVYCEWGRHWLLCWLRNSARSSVRRINCPQNKHLWLDIVYDWAKNKRDPRGINLSTIPGTHNIGDEIASKKADIYVKFNDPEAVAKFVLGLQDYDIKNINISICKDLIRGYKIWRKVQDGFTTHKQARLSADCEIKKIE